jgi:hypothetical protein
MISNLTRVALLSLIATLAGCASGPSYKSVSASIPPVAEQQGRIYVYRVTTAGAAIQPDVYLNKSKIGSAVPQGFFYVDRPAGDYEVTTTTELKKSLTLHLDEGETRYVRLGISMGVFAGHVYPELVEEKMALKELNKTKSVTK